MGKPTGFIEFIRKLPTDVAPSDRIHNWDEFHVHLPEENLRTQGTRFSTTFQSIYTVMCQIHIQVKAADI